MAIQVSVIGSGAEHEENAEQVGRLLDLAFAGTTYAWLLDSDGEWNTNHGRDHLQELLIENQRRRRVVT